MLRVNESGQIVNGVSANAHHSNGYTAQEWDKVNAFFAEIRRINDLMTDAVPDIKNELLAERQALVAEVNKTLKRN
jgi:hypothetical protein